MAHAKVLQAGAVSAPTRRTATLTLLLLACGMRAWTHVSSAEVLRAPRIPLADLLVSPTWPWVDPPLPALVMALAHLLPRPDVALLGLELIATVVVVITLLRLGERWLDFDVAVLAVALWSVCAPAVAAGTGVDLLTWRTAVVVMAAASIFRVARRRAPETSWRVGGLCGLLTVLGGGGILWGLIALVWLPVTSNRFRGRGWLHMAGLVVAGWIVVVSPIAIRNAALFEGDPKLPLAGAASGLHLAATTGGVRAPVFSERLRANVSGPVSVAYADSVLRAQGAPVDAAEWTRSANLLSATLNAAGEDGGRGWRAAVRRVVAFAGGWSEPEPGVPAALPWWIVTVLAWAGVLALLPGARPLFPLLAGGFIALLHAAAFGIDRAVLAGASPFVCLYAGYGVWRIWSGRHWALTWLLAPLALLVAALVHLGVRGWS